MSAKAERDRAEIAAARLYDQIDYRLSSADVVDRRQAAVVIRALADHTAIMGALAFSVPEDSPWPQATSLGRWYHAVADALEGKP